MTTQMAYVVFSGWDIINECITPRGTAIARAQIELEKAGYTVLRLPEEYRQRLEFPGHRLLRHGGSHHRSRCGHSRKGGGRHRRTIWWRPR
jgi:hypothetical protein